MYQYAEHKPGFHMHVTGKEVCRLVRDNISHERIPLTGVVVGGVTRGVMRPAAFPATESGWT